MDLSMFLAQKVISGMFKAGNDEGFNGLWNAKLSNGQYFCIQ